MKRCCLSPSRRHRLKSCEEGQAIARLDEVFNGPRDIDRCFDWITSINWRWPANASNTLLPWYSMLWASVWYVPAFLAVCLLCLIVLIWQGPRAASQVWEDVV